MTTTRFVYLVYVKQISNGPEKKDAPHNSIMEGRESCFENELTVVPTWKLVVAIRNKQKIRAMGDH